MNESTRREFVDFVSEHTSSLFDVAYALAGRQDAAERLLQDALEKTLLRWRRVEDPLAHAVRVMRRLSIPWWRRWRYGRTVEAGIEQSDGAGPGRPVNLADFALAGARRRRFTRVGIATGVAAAVASAAAAPLALELGTDSGPQPAIDLTDKSVIASYRHGAQYLLNPETGEYEAAPAQIHEGLLSPDLRWSVTLVAEEATATVRSTVDHDMQQSIELPDRARWIAWSPDSTQFVVTPPLAGAPYPDIPGYQEELREWARTHSAGFESVIIVDATSLEVTEVDLELPRDRTGWADLRTTAPVGAFWFDAEHVAVPLLDQTVRLPDLRASEQEGEEMTAPVVASVGVFDLAGSIVAELPISTHDIDTSSEPHAGMIWMPTGLMRDDRFLLVRESQPNVLELAASDLGAGSGPYESVSVRLPEVPGNVSYGPGRPLAWLADGRVLVSPHRRLPYQPLNTVLVADLSTGADLGEVGWTELVNELAPQLPIPRGATDLTIVDAAALPAPAAPLAF